MASNSWTELTLVGHSLGVTGEMYDSSEPGRKRGESYLRDVNSYLRVRAVSVHRFNDPPPSAFESDENDTQGMKPPPLTDIPSCI